MRSLSAMAIATLASTASAFWQKGHMLVARRAQEILEAENPAVFDYAVDQLRILEQYYPDLCNQEKNYPFVESSTFADHIKGMGYSFQSDWHFINIPYLDQGGELSDYDFVEPSVDVVQALTTLTAFLKGEVGPDFNTYTQQIAEKFSYESDQKSFALRMIIHYVGDVHQPLHTTAEVDPTYPTGDRGGNSEQVPSSHGASNLHAIWDSVIYEYDGKPSQPLSSDAFDYYTTQANEMHEKYPIDMSKVNPGEFAEWANEGLELSQEFVYNDFTAGEIPSEEYQTKALAALEQHMMYAGQRLADLMVDIYGDVANKEPMFLA